MNTTDDKRKRRGNRVRGSEKEGKEAKRKGRKK